MLSKDIYTLEYITKPQAEYKKDPSLLERVMYAFGLLEAISKVKMPFIFKGGTCLMLLTNQPMRLSTDIDIIVEPGTDIDYFIAEAGKLFPFKNVHEQKRIGKNNIEKRHFKFTYDSPILGKEFYILLDVVFMKNPYYKTIEKEIDNTLLLTENEPITVKIPSADCILGDKLTAFAPHTTGIPLGEEKDLEVMKQMFDVAILTDYLTDFDAFIRTYETSVHEELSFRGLSLSKEDVLLDTIQSAICIISKGQTNKKEYPLFINGCRSLDSHVLLSLKYSGEIAAIQACKVMYLATCLLTNTPFTVIDNPEAYIDISLNDSKYRRLSYIKKLKLEAYAYLVEAVKLLEE